MPYYDTKVTSHFHATIEDVDFRDEASYDTVIYILNVLADHLTSDKMTQPISKFDLCFDNEFIADLDNAIRGAWLESDSLSHQDLEKQLTREIQQITDAKDLRLGLFHDKFDQLNDNLRLQMYEFQKL